MQAIITKYLGPTDTKDIRIKARCSAGSITVARDTDLSVEADCKRVAGLLCDKLQAEYYDRHPEAKGKEQFPQWDKWRLIGGCLPNEEHCFVFTS